MEKVNQESIVVAVTGNCEKHGDFPGTEMRIGSQKISARCPKCAEELEAEYLRRQAEGRQRELVDRIDRNRKSAGIPARFAGCRFDNYSCSLEAQHNARQGIQRFAERFEQIEKAGASLTLCGKPGTGKTHLAMALANFLLGQGKQVFYRPMYEMLREIKDTWNRAADYEGPTEGDVIARYVRADLLILDEVGVQFGSEAEKILAFQVLDGRYMANKPTVICSNLDEAPLAAFIGERVMDRLREHGSAVLAFDWSSYRRRA